MTVYARFTVLENREAFLEGDVAVEKVKNAATTVEVAANKGIMIAQGITIAAALADIVAS